MAACSNAFTWEVHGVLSHNATTVVADARPCEQEAKLQFSGHQLEFLLLTASPRRQKNKQTNKPLWYR